AARLESDLPSEWRHHRARSYAEFFLVRASDLRRDRVPADRSDYGRELEIHDVRDRIPRYVLDDPPPPHHQVRRRYPARTAGCVAAAEPDRAVHFHSPCQSQ